MSGEFDYNHIGIPEDGGNAALRLTFPDRRFRVYVMPPDRLSYLCSRIGDVVLSVQSHRDGQAQPTHQFTSLPPCSRQGEPHLPPALEATEVAHQEAIGMAPLLAAARDYWRAYAVADRDKARAAGLRTIGLGRKLLEGPAADTARAIIDGVSATIPALGPNDREP